MPYVNIKVTREEVTAEQKERLIRGAKEKGPAHAHL
jgi:phenylpyruvate tautomerase PptA (4-oxalocrotonate tautomerase family)